MDMPLKPFYWRYMDYKLIGLQFNYMIAKKWKIRGIISQYMLKLKKKPINSINIKELCHHFKSYQHYNLFTN